tara:strand:+ start:293 stop:517 length:225 start_codon:yes stop_codon:yes gene_type:complete
MAKLFDENKKYKIELDIAEAHTISEALRHYGKDTDCVSWRTGEKGDKVLEGYVSELRTKIHTVHERYASELNSK